MALKSSKIILALLSDGVPRSFREIVRESGLSERVVEGALRRLCLKGLVLRTEEPIRKRNRVFKGRAGIRSNLRSYHLYVLKPKDKDSIEIKGLKFVKVEKRKDKGVSKAKLILKFLEDNKDQAFYSKEIAEALRDKGVSPQDVMSNVRRFEKKGLVYVRGYNTHGRQTPFRDGYLITWIDQNKPRDHALAEAIERTEKALSKREDSMPILRRVRQIRDLLIEATELKDIVSFDYIKNRLDCSDYEAQQAIERAMQLYPDIKEVRVFNIFRYYYLDSMAEEELRKAIRRKEEYIRVVKSRENRIGHNWEACVEFFIDNFTVGAKFWTQEHRSKMDPRRITIHLIKPVRGRKMNAEVDRVWEVTPGPLLKPTIYVLECKYGLIRKEDIDDFFEVLRWSKEFGVDTPEGRRVKQGVIGVFAGKAFNPKEKIRLKDERLVSLPEYAARMNIQLLKASDFNQKLREKGCPLSVTVQKICKIARDEVEVREILQDIWQNPKKAQETLEKVARKNEEIFELEKYLAAKEARRVHLLEQKRLLKSVY